MKDIKQWKVMANMLAEKIQWYVLLEEMINDVGVRLEWYISFKWIFT